MALDDFTGLYSALGVAHHQGRIEKSRSCQEEMSRGMLCDCDGSVGR